MVAKKVTGYLPENGEGVKKAFQGADIIVIPAGIPRMQDLECPSSRVSTIDHLQASLA